MKQKLGLILATMISTALLAQTTPPGGTPPPSSPPPLPAAPDNSTPPPATQPPSTSIAPLPPDQGTTTNAPVKKKKKKTTAKKKTSKPAAEMPPGEPLVPGEPAVARQNNVNIRGQAHINSEVVGHLKSGEAVTVLEVVTLKHPKTDEPANWAKIALPSSLHVWVNTPFIDATSGTVKARKLNLRTGPGENYSVIGVLQKGDAVKPGETKGDWTQIEAPTNAFAFVAAHLLTHKAPEPVPPPQPPQPLPQPPTQVAVQNPGQIAPPPTEPPANPGTTPLPQPNVPLPQVAPAPPPAPEEPPPPRIVEREGLVGNSVSIQAPSHYELKSLDDGTIIDYLYTTSPKLALAKYKGLTILVTGLEELDERWPSTPVLTIQKIQVVK